MLEKIKFNYIKENIEESVIKKILNAKQSGIDTEACNRDLDGMEYGLDPHLGRPRLLQIYPENNDVVYIFDLVYLPEKELEKIKYILENIKGVVGQSLRYEIKMLWGIGLDLTNCKWLYDTEIAEYVLTNGLDKLKKSLKELSNRYLNLDISKELQVSDWSKKKLSEEQLYYAALDAYLVLPIKKKQIELAKQINLLFLSNEKKNIFKILELEFNFVKCISALEFNGMHVDIDLWEKNLPDYENKLINYELEILKQLPNTYKQKTFTGGYKFNKNISSPVQLLEDLKLLGIPTNSTSEGELKMLDTEKYPIIKSIDKYRKTNKIINTYLKPFRQYINKKTNRVHPSYFQLSSKTGRVQVKDPALYTIPRSKDFRQCFIGQDKYYFLDIDYSQIESRCTAVAANETKMINIFNNDQDIYAATAALENGYEINEFLSFKNSEDKKLQKVFKDGRQGAKSEVLGLCLVKDTQIITSNGYKNIQDIQIEDLVLTHKKRYKPVTQLFKRQTNELIEVKTNTGKTIKGTPEHELYVFFPYKNKFDWIKLKNLKIGNFLLGLEENDFGFEEILKIRINNLIKNEEVYDFEVEDDHSFVANDLISSNCYSMGVDRYRDYCEQTFGVKKTREQAEKERSVFLFSTYPGLPRWHKNTWKKWNGKYYIFNQTGRIYFNLKGIDYTFCINFPIQSVATDFFKIAASNIFDYLKDKYKVPPILNYSDILLVCSWHDALTFEGKKEILEEEKSSIEKFMIDAAEECLDYKVKIKAEGVIAKDWYSAHA